MPVLASASVATRVTTLRKRNVFIVDYLSVRFVGLGILQLTDVKVRSGRRATDVGSCAGNNSLDLAAKSDRRIVELEGPRRITPNEVSVTFSRILGKPVRIEVVPLDTWGELFTSQGMKNPTPRIQMLDGFNQGWIEFEGGEACSEKGSTELVTVLRNLVENRDL
jgi:uncharacterized protein YbjT (DUF2867 family)